MSFSTIKCFDIRPKKAVRPLLLATLLVSGLPFVQAKEYYKWVDEKGVSHFSEKPVPGKNAVKMGGTTKTEEHTATETSSSATGDASDTATSTTSARVGNALNDASASNDAVCKSAKTRLASLQSGQRIKMVGDDGKAAYLDANQIADEIAKTQALIKASCP